MSNVLRITTSTVGYDSQNTPPKSNMVTRPDTKVQAPVVRTRSSVRMHARIPPRKIRMRR